MVTDEVSRAEMQKLHDALKAAIAHAEQIDGLVAAYIEMALARLDDLS